MTDVDDFSPIVEQGELEPTSRLRRGMRRRNDLGALDAGFVRVLTAADGSHVLEHERTSGERQWGQVRSWIKIDVGFHTLEYRVAFNDPTGRAGFTADVSVRAKVSDPSSVASQGIASVKTFLEPAVRRAVVQASMQIEPTSHRDPIVALTTMRQRAEAQIRTAVDGPVGQAPEWLDAEFVAVMVRFDDATQRHHTELIDSSRKGELIDSKSVNEEKETKAALAIRAIWRDELLPHLSDPVQRVFEVAFANPTEQNLARAVDQVTSGELQLLAQGFELLQTMVDKDFVDKDDPFYAAIEAMSGKLAHLYLPGAAAALSAGKPDAELPRGDDANEQAVDHEPPDVEEEEGDRDWDDR